MFPDLWKTARVCPIPKVTNASEPKDFRPISVLPILSKIFEKIILQQLSKFIEEEAIYKSTQAGFRKGHSTVTLLLKLKDDIIKASKRGEITLAVFADYSKAFDTVHHETLLKKLHYLNFSKSTIHTIHSYLTNRTQYVQIDDKKSTQSNINYGVPQGSILGPILFNIYVTDLTSNTSTNCLQYADDTNLYSHCKPKDIASCCKEMEKNIKQITSWSRDNNLIFNPEKQNVCCSLHHK